MENIQSQVLVIENDLQTRRLISTLLQRVGIQAILVKDGKTAMALLKEGLVPSLIILDLVMPEMDSLEMLGNIRQMSAMDKIPILILFDEGESWIFRRGLEAGADAYVAKAYLEHNLVDRARILLAAGRQQQPRTRTIRHTAPLPSLPSSSADAPSIESPCSDTDSDDVM